jgi:hypothetical protein
MLAALVVESAYLCSSVTAAPAHVNQVLAIPFVAHSHIEVAPTQRDELSAL